MLHKNYHDTVCITGFVFKTKYLRGWKSKDERGEIETKKKNNTGGTILMCIKEESEIKIILKRQRKMFYCGKKSRQSRRYSDRGSICIKQYGLETCKMGTKKTLGRSG